MFSPKIRNSAAQTIAVLNQKSMQIVTAESCTGGLIAGALTSVPGSSEVVHGGFITYANLAKQQMIGVPEQILNEHGAVSEQTARCMADGARAATGVDVAIAVTGIAGPGGGSAEKPVGLVYIGCAAASGTYTQKHLFGDIGRDDIRSETILAALTLVRDIVLYDHP